MNNKFSPQRRHDAKKDPSLGAGNVKNQYKKQTQKQWNRNPCGILGIDENIPYGSLEFFEAVKQKRYESESWIKEKIDFTSARGKKVLEIGYGMGTDLRTFRENGAKVYGVDITPEHNRLARLNFKLHRETAELKLCDAANLPFPSGTFDIVYSNGVLHHTPDTVRCLSEAYRVLKPGGRLILALYRKNSAYHWIQMLLVNGILKGQLRKLGYAGLLSTIEYGADGIKVKPLVKLYGGKQLKIILSDFSQVETKVTFFKREHLSKFGWFLPRFMEKVLEPWFGWYVVAYAVK